MEVIESRAVHDLNLASRKAQDAGKLQFLVSILFIKSIKYIYQFWVSFFVIFVASRRIQATEWLESFVGPLGISKEPSEKEFISCLRNGLILCKAINKIQPGSVQKVVEISRHPSQSLLWDSQPLPAYQFFENVRNFLKAVEDLNLPVFEASVFERDNMEADSSTKIVDCVLGLKDYKERKQNPGGNGVFKHINRCPLVMHSNGRNPRPAAGLDPNRQLDLSTNCGKQPPSQNDHQKHEDLIVKALTECMINAKENLDGNLLSSIRNGNTDSVKWFSKILSSALEEQLQYKFPESFQACLNKDDCNHWQVFKVQEKKLQTVLYPTTSLSSISIFQNLKALLSSTKAEFGDLQSQWQHDLKQMGMLKMILNVLKVEELSTAAQGYHKVVKENRTLYNMVQDLKGNIRVYCRIRPAFRADTKNVIDFIGEDGSLVVLDPSKPNKDGKKLFQFNRIFGPTATQEEVFADTQPLIRSVMDGYNVCIFAYGQTGSGKTHTMCGPSGASRKELGINYLALSDLFDLSNSRKDVIKYELYVQMVEIYNEQVRDLVTGDSANTSKLEIRSCTTENGLSLPDATMHSVKSTTDVLNLMKVGQVNRAVSSTALNHQSSRSHSILTVHIHGKDASGGTIRSCLHLVDLAGSERVDKSEVTGEGLKEAQYINKSLSCLGDVITALSQKNSYIPYRNSKLTLLLQNSLGGNAKTLMFAHVSPEGDSFGETVSTLKFAQRASTVELGAARLNKESREVMDLKEQIETLKRQLAEKEPQSAQTANRLEPRSPLPKPKPVPMMMERTPPRSRRLSTENKCPPKSPNSGSKSRALKTDGRITRIPSLVLPKTPEPPQVSIRNAIIISSESKEPTGITNGKTSSSHIRKSLRTIGKLINGSEKRIQSQKTNEVVVASPATVGRPSRRQSLTGIQPSRRSSLGGVENCKLIMISRKGAKTPPPVVNSSSNMKQWM
ncbi:Calponin homology domain-containing protein [Cynara cardunculus var. scolymus]|uniref:Calponin homology domain-containing protein n=1 Tax=Cynara cardunculus var. scolymus TaxID=59895 RepID=A0A103YN06_CYNCS|nr:Calponin homology domain-containing protein [Cynara cardunculus var. scolymus]